MAAVYANEVAGHPSKLLESALATRLHRASVMSKEPSGNDSIVHAPSSRAYVLPDVHQLARLVTSCTLGPMHIETKLQLWAAACLNSSNRCVFSQLLHINHCMHRLSEEKRAGLKSICALLGLYKARYSIIRSQRGTIVAIFHHNAPIVTI